MKERQAWCNLQSKLCDPCLSALTVCVSTKMALYKYSSFPTYIFTAGIQHDTCSLSIVLMYSRATNMYNRLPQLQANFWINPEIYAKCADYGNVHQNWKAYLFSYLD